MTKRQLYRFLGASALVLGSLPLALAQPAEPQPSVLTEEQRFEQMLRPTIREIEFPTEMGTRLSPQTPQPNEHFMDSFDDTPIHLTRSGNMPAKLFVKGGAPVNNLEIRPLNGNKEDYPLIDQTFRSTHTQEVDLSKLPDGVYEIKVSYSQREVRTTLELRSNGGH